MFEKDFSSRIVHNDQEMRVVVDVKIVGMEDLRGFLVIGVSFSARRRSLGRR